MNLKIFPKSAEHEREDANARPRRGWEEGDCEINNLHFLAISLSKRNGDKSYNSDWFGQLSSLSRS